MAPAYLEREEEEEASPFLTDRQPEVGLRAVLRTGLRVALEAAALLACVAAVATLLGVHHGAVRQPRNFLGLDSLIQEVDTLDNVSGNTTSNATNATETCPDGFVATQLDMQNHDADMHELAASLEECAAKCNEDAECKGFEHNMVAQHCWVSRVGHHCTDKQHEDWISCVKGDSDACEDGGSSTSEAPSGSSSAGSGGGGDVTTTAAGAAAGAGDGDGDGDGAAAGAGASPGPAPATEDGSAADPDTAPTTETCPGGYVGTNLDMLNEDADMIEASLEDCATKCNEDPKCKGFEHNMASRVCWVSRKGRHCSDEQHEDWISCIKGDSDACEDGGPNDE